MLVALGACDAVSKKLTSTSVTNDTIGVKLNTIARGQPRTLRTRR